MIFGLTGKIGSGKTALLDNIKGCVKLNFKEPLVREIENNFPDLLRELRKLYKAKTNKQLFEEKKPLVRALLQNYGTDVRRTEDDDYWIKKIIDRLPSRNKCVIIGDVRFINEAKMIREFGGKIIRITRENTDNGSHKSELEMNKIIADHTIENNGTIEEMVELFNVIKKYEEGT